MTDVALNADTEHEDRADDEHHAGEPAAQHAVPTIPVAVVRIPSPKGHPLQVPGGAQHQAVAGIVQGIGQHGDAVGPETAGHLHEGEGEVDEKGRAQRPRSCGVHMSMRVLMLVMARVVMNMDVRHAAKVTASPHDDPARALGQLLLGLVQVHDLVHQRHHGDLVR